MIFYLLSQVQSKEYLIAKVYSDSQCTIAKIANFADLPNGSCASIQASLKTIDGGQITCVLGSKLKPNPTMGDTSKMAQFYFTYECSDTDPIAAIKPALKGDYMTSISYEDGVCGVPTIGTYIAGDKTCIPSATNSSYRIDIRGNQITTENFFTVTDCSGSASNTNTVPASSLPANCTGPPDGNGSKTFITSEEGKSKTTSIAASTPTNISTKPMQADEPSNAIATKTGLLQAFVFFAIAGCL